MKHTLRMALGLCALSAGCGLNDDVVEGTPEALGSAVDPGGTWVQGSMPEEGSGPVLALADRSPEAVILGQSARVHLVGTAGQELAGVYVRAETDESGYWDVPKDALVAPASTVEGEAAADASGGEAETGAVVGAPASATRGAVVRKQTADGIAVELSLPRTTADVDVCFYLRGYDAAGAVGNTVSFCFTGVNVESTDRASFGTACDDAIECGLWEPAEREECIAVGAAGMNILRREAPRCRAEHEAYRDCITSPATCTEIADLNRAIREDEPTLPRCQAEVDAVFECAVGGLLGDALDNL